MNSLPFGRRQSFAALAGLMAFALTGAPSSADAQTSVNYSSGQEVWYVSADGSTVVGVENTASGQFAFVLRGGNKTTLSLGGESFPSGVSGDGATVVGNSQTSLGDLQAFVWTSGNGTSPLLPFSSFSSASGISADGSTIIGTESTPQGLSGFVVKGTGKTNFTFGGNSIDLASVSADGSTVVGSATLPGTFMHQAFFWRSGDVAPTLVPFSTTSASEATAVSADGSTVIGWKFASPKRSPFVWRIGSATASFIDLGGFFASANSVSADGSAVVGDGYDASNNLKGFVWRNGVLQVLAPPAGRQYSSAFLVSANGVRIVGYAANDPTDTLEFDSQDIVVWDGDAAPVFLKDLLTAAGATLGEPRLRDATGMSADGSVIAGNTLLRTSDGAGGFTDVNGAFVAAFSTQQEPTPTEMTQDLIDKVVKLNLPKGVGNALLSKLQTALAAIVQNDDITAVAALTNFIDQVRAQRGKKIPAATADELVADAQAILVKLL